MKKFTEEDLIVRSPKQIMLSNLPLKKGKSISAEILCNMIKNDAQLLGTKDVEYFKSNEWWYIFSKDDWLFKSSYEIRSIDDLFTQMNYFPEKGRNACRLECYLWALSESVYTLLNDKITLIKGKNININLLQKNISSKKYKRLIIFKDFKIGSSPLC